MRYSSKLKSIPPMIWLRKSISRKLNFLILITILIFSIVTGYVSYKQTKDIIIENTEKNLKNQSESIALQVNAILKEKGTIVKQIRTNQNIVNLLNSAKSRNDLFENNEYLSSENALNNILKTDSQLALVWAASEEGNFFIGSNHHVSKEQFNLYNRPWYLYVNQSSGLYYTEPYVDEVTGKVTVSIIEKVYDGSKIIGYVGIDMLLSVISEMMNSYNIGPTSYSFLLSKEGNVLYHPDETLILSQSTNTGNQIIEQVTSKMLGNQSGFEFVTSDQNDEFLGYSFVPINNWSVGVAISKDDVYIPIMKVEKTIMILTIVISLLLIILIHIFLKFTLRKIPALVTNLNMIKDGNLSISFKNRSIDEVGQITQAIQLMLDQLKKNIDNINYLANFDQLTGLPNRRLMSETLETAIKMSEIYDSKFALVFLDLDDFKQINDTEGHTVGDLILKEFSKRLQGSLGAEATITRFGGDEFVIIIHQIDHRLSILKYTQSIQDTLEKPIIIKNKVYHLNASIGVSYYPEHGKTIDDLLSKSDIAMYQAKENGKNKLQFFHSSMMDNMLKKSKVESLLLGAIERGEFLLHYQPQYVQKTLEIRGFEALIRWESSELGFVSPDVLIPILEETGYIIQVGDWVIREACLKIKKWHSLLDYKPTIAVNVSPVQLRDENFAVRVKEIIKETGIDPSYLEIEITESILIDSFDRAKIILQELHAQGINIALDDFGTGYASISYLKKLPIQILKIDRQFIQGIHNNNENRIFASAMIRLAHELKLMVVAEGVESAEHLDYLEYWGCDYLQGYYFAKPQPESEVLKLAKSKIVHES